ncbi:TetR/AcrR family transcriptional regulator [Arthrobacter sp. zg-Y916]|uniref:TetR/AcrR family transcriptional regulator n=1 Tax=Arthrobacter caoxuetaonis TaxID=2886935 RepID=A0A9X1MA70_9MICC|nr:MULTISPECIES: TetR/AcrR family transcriptional regulator [Arthrobacter]MCC3296328.1 TetR/AcrR family transcriptional regulator [Arthrobacter caoxuetaonis]MCC9192404.1 TetR/AcrR family transcriptional regulator [Arthrobacter sp. zg-Y916]USQ56826.1 TetR/AcrR family transcriptional regulator [Arthrobacter caoxuetaonis]
MAPTPPAGTPPVRDRILAAAGELFYAEGIRAVSADKIIAAASTTKVTFYRYFPTKDDLVAGYLDAQSDRIREAAARLPADPCQALAALADAMGTEACRPGFRGCPFINAAAEYPAADHPVRAAVERHRNWFHGLVADLAARLGAEDPQQAADQLVMLRDGAMVHGYVSDPTGVGPSLLQAGRAVLQLHLPAGTALR